MNNLTKRVWMSRVCSLPMFSLLEFSKVGLKFLVEESLFVAWMTFFFIIVESCSLDQSVPW